MDRPGPPEEPVVTGAVVIGPGLDGAGEVQRVERLEPRFIIGASPLQDFGGELDEPLGMAQYIVCISFAIRARVPPGLVLEGV
jgi:hypothetical protein